MRHTTCAAAVFAGLFVAAAAPHGRTDQVGEPTVTQGRPTPMDAGVKGILDEIKLVPPTRRRLTGEADVPLSKLPTFSSKIVDTYKPDGDRLLDELRKLHKTDRKQFARAYPVQTVVFDAINGLLVIDKMVIRDTLKAPITPKLKAEFMQLQGKDGQAMFELERVHQAMSKVAENELVMDRSVRWRAHFDFVEARLMARIAFLYEYSYLLGQIRQDALPALQDGADGWKLVSQEKLQVPEPKAKQYAKQAAKAWRDIQKNYPDTPWAFFAQHDSAVPLGLAWQTKKP